MNKEILEEEGWDLEKIELRTKELIEKICKLYPYAQVTEEEMKKYDIYYKNNANNISAIMYEDQTVEIQPESCIIHCFCVILHP